MAYRNAWKCRKCPQSNGEDGCPAWCEYVETNPSTGEEKLTKECVFQALPKFLVHAVAAANQAAQSADSHRNEVLSAMALASRHYLKHAPSPALEDRSNAP